MGSDRYIELSGQIVDKEKIARLYWKDRTLWVVIPGEPDFSLEGEDASILWRAFTEKDWRD